MSCVLFARSRHPSMLSSYFFSTHTYSVRQYVKELFSSFQFHHL
nr:MAG TPA: hypothetical protein [Caudoviricetes sp.]